MAARLHIGNLPFDATEDTIRALFTNVGSVVSVDLARDPFNGESRCYAFVEMSTEEEVKAAISSLRKQSFGNRLMTVRIARPGEGPIPYHNRSRPRRAVGG